MVAAADRVFRCWFGTDGRPRKRRKGGNSRARETMKKGKRRAGWGKDPPFRVKQLQ